MDSYNNYKYTTAFNKFLILGVSTLSACNIYSAAFMLNEQNVSGLGNAYAGRTVLAEDASTSFYNPAGLVFMQNHQVLGSVVGPIPKFELTTKTVLRASGTPVAQGKIKDDAGSLIPIPAFHVAGKINENWFYGLSVTSPFGLKTQYSKTSRARYFGTTSGIETIDINPNLGYKINNQWSVGVGASAQYVRAKLNKQIDSTVFLGAAENITSDGKAHNTADGWGYGYNFGALYQPSSKTRLGLAFRSKIKHSVEGDLKISIPAGVLSGAIITARGLVDQNVTSSVTLPEVLSISAFQSISPEWDVMGDLTFVNWHRFKKLVLKYQDTNLSDSRTEEKFKDTIKIAVGANYKYDNKTKFKFGAAFDDSPVSKKHRNIRIPDSDRFWLSTGAQYKVDKNFTIDAAYSYIFVKSASVSESPTGAPASLITGDYSSHIHLLGVQAVYNFV